MSKCWWYQLLFLIMESVEVLVAARKSKNYAMQKYAINMSCFSILSCVVCWKSLGVQNFATPSDCIVAAVGLTRPLPLYIRLGYVIEGYSCHKDKKSEKKKRIVSKKRNGKRNWISFLPLNREYVQG